MHRVTLNYRDGGSDKVYQAAIVPKDNRFVVTFAFGRRGTTLQTGVKTPVPVDFETAETVFQKLIREKTAKGYTKDEDGTPYSGMQHAKELSEIRPQLLNPIDEERARIFAKSPLWCLQEKFDGRRLLVKKEGSRIRGINRKGFFVEVPVFLAEAFKSIESNFLIDGELVGDTYHAFDIVFEGAALVSKRSFKSRQKCLRRLLSRHTSEHVQIVETHVEETQKLAALKGLEECGAEGVVLRLLSGPYTIGSLPSDGFALKYKFTTTGSFIVAGVNGNRTVSLRVFDEDSLLGNVTIPPNHDIPMPDSVVEVRYLYCFRGGRLFQPVYLGERDDVGPEECLVSQLKFKRMDSDDDGE